MPAKMDTQVSVRFRTEPEEVMLEEPGGDIPLRRVPSGSGAKYSDGRLTFWSKGTEASIENDGKIVHRRCVGEPA
jgi:membrane-bound inhibitor of C-type lysozyme